MIFIKKLLRIAISVVVVCSVSNVYAMRQPLKDKHYFQKNKKNRSDDNKLVKQINDLFHNVRMVPINYRKHGERPNLLRLQQDQENIEKNGNFGLLSHKVKRLFFIAKKIIEGMVGPIQANMHQRAQSISVPQDSKPVRPAKNRRDEKEDNYDGASIVKRGRMSEQRDIFPEMQNLADGLEDLKRMVVNIADPKVLAECQQRLEELEAINFKIDLESAYQSPSFDNVTRFRSIYNQIQEMFECVRRAITGRANAF